MVVTHTCDICQHVLLVHTHPDCQVTLEHIQFHTLSYIVTTVIPSHKQFHTGGDPSTLLSGARVIPPHVRYQVPSLFSLTQYRYTDFQRNPYTYTTLNHCITTFPGPAPDLQYMFLCSPSLLHSSYILQAILPGELFIQHSYEIFPYSVSKVWQLHPNTLPF
jgi:hypothetical protein